MGSEMCIRDSSYVVMSVDGKILVINGENDSATEEIYHTISEKMSRELE